MRLPANNAAGTATNDTTEVQIGAGLSVPDWARSIRSLHYHLITLAITTKESIGGYIRLVDDKNTLDPLNFPLPISTGLGTTIQNSSIDSITVPCDHNVAENDTIRAYAALDEISTGVHTIQAYIGFSSHPASFQMKSQKSAVIAASAVANTEAGTATLSTIAERTSAILGFWNEFHTYPTAAQTMGGYMKIASSAKDWQEQLIPTNMLPSGLGADLEPAACPMFAVPTSLGQRMNAVNWVEFPEEFPLKTKQDFVCTNYMDGTNTVAPAGRYGIIWRE